MGANHKRLIVIEGPAGSGKTTLLKNLQANIPGSAIATYPIERPRDYAGTVLEGVAIIKDMANIVTAFTMPEETVFIDRWAVSQFVYTTIRINRIDRAKWTRMMVTMAEMRSLALLSLKEKEVVPDYLSYETKWVFLLPPTSVIENRRNKEKELNGREYPYKASVERDIFQWCTEHWDFAPCTVLDGSEFTVDVANDLLRSPTRQI